VRSLWIPLALIGLLWLGLTCSHVPAQESVASSSVDELLVSACERALASLAPDPEPARRVPVSLPIEDGPAVRALHGTGRGARVLALEAALERSARLALAELRPWLVDAAGRFAPDDADALLSGPGDALTVAFRKANESELRAQLSPAVERSLGPAGANEALAAVQDGARRLPLSRRVEPNLVSLVTENAISSFFTALAEEERRLREERVARRD